MIVELIWQRLEYMMQKFQKSKWGCDGCGSLLNTKTSYSYFRGICYLCRSNVPSYIPEEQILKWIRNQKLQNT